MIAMLAGIVLALLALGYVVYPLLRASDSGDESARAAGALCSSCGARAEAGAVFCWSCGRPLVP